MRTLANSETLEVGAVDVRFEGGRLFIDLSDGRVISVPLAEVSWLQWLAHASTTEQEAWTIEPRGFAVYWDALDDGIEIKHLLGMQPLSSL